MEALTSFWRLGMTETLLVFAFILLVADIFFVTELPTHIAWVLVSYAVVRLFDFPPLVALALGLVLWFGLLGFHYWVWRGVLERIANKMAPDRWASGERALVGKFGTMRWIEGKPMVLVEGELHPVITPSAMATSPEDGSRVEIIGADEGELSIRKSEDS